MDIPFQKWHGALNDFLVFWISEADGDIVQDSLRRQAVRLCDRRSGVGADGLLILRTKTRGDLLPSRLTIVNSDGSLAKNCGNGLRCAASSVLMAHRGVVDPEEYPEAVDLEVAGHTYTCRFLKRKVAFPLVAVEMGVPKLGDDVAWAKPARLAVQALARELAMPWLADEIGVCEIGNPHLVLSADRAGAIDLRAALLAVGPRLQTIDGLDGINVHLVRSETLSDKDLAKAGQELGMPVSELVRAWVWERGAGETMACGSGACAIVACATQTGLVERSDWVAVDMPGGRLYVRCENDDDPAVLAGPAAYVFSGHVGI